MRTTLRTAAAAAILMLMATVFLPGVAQAAPNCGAVVTTNTTVTANLTDCPGDGLIIGAHNITLNLNGRTIDGVGLGVGVPNNGVQLSNADTNNRVISNVVELQSQRGIAILGDSNGNVVRSNTLRQNTISTGGDDAIGLTGTTLNIVDTTRSPAVATPAST